MKYYYYWKYYTNHNAVKRINVINIQLSFFAFSLWAVTVHLFNDCMHGYLDLNVFTQIFTLLARLRLNFTV